MSHSIKGKDFVNTFNNSIVEYINNSSFDYFKLEEYYKNSTNWTNEMNYIMRVIHKNLLTRKELENNHVVMYKEYFKIDYSIWREKPVDQEFENYIGCIKGKSKSSSEKTWKILAAIEHENDKKDWLYEMKQLLCFNTSLKVLISYEESRSITSRPDKLEKVLNMYAKTSRLDVGDEFIFIFGNTYVEAVSEGIEYVSTCFRVVEQESCHKYILSAQNSFNVKSNSNIMEE